MLQKPSEFAFQPSLLAFTQVGDLLRKMGQIQILKPPRFKCTSLRPGPSPIILVIGGGDGRLRSDVFPGFQYKHTSRS